MRMTCTGASMSGGPAEPFAETITHVSSQSWRMNHEAAAWIWYGPPLDKPTTPEQR